MNSVPVIVGLCQDEGNIMTAPYHKEHRRWELVTRDWDQWAPLIFFNRERELITESDQAAAASIAQFYFGDNVDMSSLARTPGNLVKLGRIYSMAYFYSGADHDVRLLSSAGVPVYPLILSHPPNFSLMDIFRLSLGQLVWSFTARSLPCLSDPHQADHGVCHGDDLNYLFPMSPFPESVVTEDQVKVRQLLLDLISSFSLRGQPSYSDPSDGLTTLLDTVDKNDGIDKYFNISPEPGVVNSESLREELEFWNKVMEQSRNRKWNLLDQLPTTLHKKIAVNRM